MNNHEISAVLQERFGLSAHVQVIRPKGENRTLYELEHIPFNRRMTMAGLERLCRRIAKALDAELCGTVNIDFVSLGDATPSTCCWRAWTRGGTIDHA